MSMSIYVWHINKYYINNNYRSIVSCINNRSNKCFTKDLLMFVFVLYTDNEMSHNESINKIEH